MKWITAVLCVVFLASCQSPQKPVPICLDGVCLAESTVLHVVSQPAVLSWTPIGASTHWQCVNSGVLTPTDSSYLRARDYTGIDPFIDDLGIESPPADMQTLTGIKVRFRALWDTTINAAQHTMYFNFLGNSGGTQMAYSDAFDLETKSAGSVHNYPAQSGDPGYVAGQEWYDMHMLSPYTFPKTTVNTAWCEVGAVIDGPAPDTTDVIRCTEIDIMYIYTPVGLSARHKMHSGIGFGPGFR